MPCIRQETDLIIMRGVMLDGKTDRNNQKDNDQDLFCLAIRICKAAAVCSKIISSKNQLHRA